MKATFVRMALAAAIATSLAGCDRDNGAGTLGQRLDNAIDRTEHQLARAGEKAQQKLADAGHKTRQALSEASEKTHEKIASAGDSIRQDTARATDNAHELATSASTPPGAKGDAGHAMSDAAITASIKTDYLKDPDLSVLKIDVDTRGGVVTLNGLASDDAARTRAERIASAIKGVREVRNFLVVKRA